nr:Biomphalaria glabrata peptidase M20 domain-containing protein 2-like [Biomphalaria glabrata]
MNSTILLLTLISRMDPDINEYNYPYVLSLHHSLQVPSLLTGTITPYRYHHSLQVPSHLTGTIYQSLSLGCLVKE